MAFNCIRFLRYYILNSGILTVSPDSVNLQNILNPCSVCGCCGDAWEKSIKIHVFGEQKWPISLPVNTQERCRIVNKYF